MLIGTEGNVEAVVHNVCELCVSLHWLGWKALSRAKKA